jgi:hypothetical protein
VVMDRGGGGEGEASLESKHAQRERERGTTKGSRCLQVVARYQELHLPLFFFECRGVELYIQTLGVRIWPIACFTWITCVPIYFSCLEKSLQLILIRACIA